MATDTVKMLSWERGLPKIQKKMRTSFMDGPCNASAYPWGQFVASKTNNIKEKRKRTEKAHVAFHQQTNKDI